MVRNVCKLVTAGGMSEYVTYWTLFISHSTTCCAQRKFLITVHVVLGINSKARQDEINY